jgi:hypothetical protein
MGLRLALVVRAQDFESKNAIHGGLALVDRGDEVARAILGSAQNAADLDVWKCINHKSPFLFEHSPTGKALAP